MTIDNPFRPPDAVLETAPIWQAGALIPDGRSVPASHGWRWARDSVLMVAATPLTWAAITLVFFILAVAISLLPIVSLLWNVALPIVLGGLMIGCDAAARGQRPEVRHLFAGFEAPRLQPLAMVGVLYLAATVIMVMCVVLVGVGGGLGVAMLVGPEQIEAQPLLVGSGIAILVLVAMGLGMALSMTIWFAPALVALHSLQALDAMRMSLRASLRNVLPFLVYGLVLLAIVTLAACAGGGVVLALGTVLRNGWLGFPEALVGAAVTGVLAGMALAPSAWCAMYASYRDVFVG
jgi:uncharacterized membrane protein